MAKHLLKFDTAAEYSAATIVPPAVSWVVSDNEIKNDNYIPTPPVVEYKATLTYSNGEVYGVPYNGDTELTEDEVDSGTQTKENIVAVEIGSGVTIIGNTAFIGCWGLTGITLPDGITTIGNGAFYRCRSLTSITIPDSVTSIGDEAFEGCDNLEYIAVKAIYPPTLGNYPFEQTTNKCPILVPYESEEDYRMQWMDYADRIQGTNINPDPFGPAEDGDKDP